MASLKVAVIGPTHPFRGGIAHHTHLLAMHLGRVHDLRVYGFERQYPAWLFPGRSQLDPSPPPVPSVDPRRWLTPWLPTTWHRVSREFLSWRPQVVVIQWWVPFMAPMIARLVHCARQAGIRTVVIAHNVVPHENRPLDRLLTRAALGAADQVVVHAPSEGERARALLGGKPIELVPFPSFAVLSRQAWSRDAARTALNLTGRILLFFGFVRPYKGLMDLLDALPQVLAEMDVSLLVVGEVWGSTELYREKVRRLNLVSRVCFVDRYVPDQRAAMYFAAADLAVLPYREATGSAVLQLAFSMGVPVVATRTGSMSGAVREERTGYLVDPGDPQGLARAIIRFFAQGRAADMRREIDGQQADAGWQPLIRAIEQGSPDSRAGT